MDRALEVHIDWQGRTVRLGRLWTRTRGARETASFEYDPTCIERRDAFALDPRLPQTAGQFHREGGLFNAFTDPAPDRWGRNL
jgi:serine/threonine-protein kinase HipA